jgi:hypothetical protein
MGQSAWANSHLVACGGPDSHWAFRKVLVVGGEKMTHLATPKVSEIIGRSIDPYERTYGATMPALAGMVSRALMARQGVSLREIPQVAVKNHANGARNPLAHFQQAVTIEEVLESRMVADPLRLMHAAGRLPLAPVPGLEHEIVKVRRQVEPASRLSGLHAWVFP